MNYCTDCAIRLFNIKHYNLKGVGNPWTGKCIVVPNVDYSAYKLGDMSFSKQVEVLKQSISITGDLLSKLYILPLIRCNETISCELDRKSYLKCLHYFSDDIKKFDFKDILLLGDAGRRFFNCDITPYLDTLLVSYNNRRYVLNYSPLIKNIDDNKYEIFKSYFVKWYNAVFTEDFSNYNIKRV